LPIGPRKYWCSFDRLGTATKLERCYKCKRIEMKKSWSTARKKGSSRWAHTSAYSADDATDGLAEVDIAAGGILAEEEIALESPCAPRGSPEREKTRFA
jgi:hypothetical protein